MAEATTTIRIQTARPFGLGPNLVLLDAAGETVYHFIGRWFEWYGSNYWLRDADGNEVLSVAKRLTLLAPAFDVCRGEEELAEISAAIGGTALDVTFASGSSAEMAFGAWPKEVYTLEQSAGPPVECTPFFQWRGVRAGWDVRIPEGVDVPLTLAICCMAFKHEASRG